MAIVNNNRNFSLTNESEIMLALAGTENIMRASITIPVSFIESFGQHQINCFLNNSRSYGSILKTGTKQYKVSLGDYDGAYIDRVLVFVR